MKEKNNAICAICGKPYYMCISCKDMLKIKPWQIHTDTSEHYKIYQVIHGFNTGIYTKEEAKLKLNNIDLSDLDDLRENIKNIIKDIIREDKKDIEDVSDLHKESVIVEDTFISDESKVSRKKKSSKIIETNEIVVLNDECE